MIDALSRKIASIGSLACLGMSKRPLAREIQALESKFIQLDISEKDHDRRTQTTISKSNDGNGNPNDGRKIISKGYVAHVEEKRKGLAKDVHRLARLGVSLTDTSDGGVIVQNKSKPSLVAEVKETQDNNPILFQLKGAVHQQKVEVFSQGGDGQLCVPRVYE
ncbi:hypothetical protein MTR67_047665 [Solanum verrucosum]|uniref:Uncharacterized protein n=1 Tax=Solanum verrucosum TaxID=315347 RepID=A0AAF0UWW6_SOLVR|nr:hypothetical protein MTR67_047665 [Solanum verrucosum]